MADPNVTMTHSQFQSLLERFSHGIADAVREARKPDEDTQIKLDEEKTRKEAHRASAIELAMAEQQSKIDRESRCNHTRAEDGKRTIGGQVHSDGKIHPLCLRCGKEFEPTDAPREMLMGATGI